MACYKSGGCGVYEMYSCSECPASKPKYLNKKDKNLLSKEEFYKKYCEICGSQRCEGIDTDWFDGCKFKDRLCT